MQFPHIQKKLQEMEQGHHEQPAPFDGQPARVPRRRPMRTVASDMAALEAAHRSETEQPAPAAPVAAAADQSAPKKPARRRRSSAKKQPAQPQQKPKKQQPAPKKQAAKKQQPAEQFKDVKLGTMYTRFHESIKSVKRLTHIAETMPADEKETADDLLRAQVVQIESAFDFFMHEVVVFGMTQIFLGEWKETLEFRSYPILMRDVRAGMKNLDDDTWFAKAVTRNYERFPLISYMKFSEVLKMIGIPLSALKKHSEGRLDARALRSIVEGASKRRNLIAHQTDRAHLSRKQNAIDAEYVRTMLNDIKCIVNAVYESALEKSEKSVR